MRARLQRAADETLAVSQDADETVSELRRQLEVEKEVAEEVEGERTKIEAAAEVLQGRLRPRPRPANGPRPTLRRWIH